MPAKMIKDCFDLHLVVSDVEKALSFWRDSLGFQIEEKLPFPRRL